MKTTNHLYVRGTRNDTTLLKEALSIEAYHEKPRTDVDYARTCRRRPELVRRYSTDLRLLLPGLDV